MYQELERQRGYPRQGYARYDQEALAQMQLDILEQWGTAAKAKHFLLEHLALPGFRRRAIAQAMERKDYHAALELAKDGMETDREWPGLVHEWRVCAYHIYEAMGETEKALELAESFLLCHHEGFGYYAVIKSACLPGQWEKKLEVLLDSFEAQPYTSDTYVQILLQEKQFERLLRLCKKDMRRMPELASKFPEEYRSSVAEVYHAFISRRARESTSRNQYRGVCELLRRLHRLDTWLLLILSFPFSIISVL